MDVACIRVEPVMDIGPVVRLIFSMRGILNHFAAPLDMLAQNIVGIVVNEINLRAGLDALPGRSNDKGRLAAFGDREDHVFGRNAQVGDLTLYQTP